MLFAACDIWNEQPAARYTTSNNFCSVHSRLPCSLCQISAPRCTTHASLGMNGRLHLHACLREIFHCLMIPKQHGHPRFPGASSLSLCCVFKRSTYFCPAPPVLLLQVSSHKFFHYQLHDQRKLHTRRCCAALAAFPRLAQLRKLTIIYNSGVNQIFEHLLGPEPQASVAREKLRHVDSIAFMVGVTVCSSG